MGVSLSNSLWNAPKNYSQCLYVIFYIATTCVVVKHRFMRLKFDDGKGNFPWNVVLNNIVMFLKQTFSGT